MGPISLSYERITCLRNKFASPPPGNGCSSPENRSLFLCSNLPCLTLVTEEIY